MFLGMATLVDSRKIWTRREEREGFVSARNGEVCLYWGNRSIMEGKDSAKGSFSPASHHVREGLSMISFDFVVIRLVISIFSVWDVF